MLEYGWFSGCLDGAGEWSARGSRSAARASPIHTDWSAVRTCSRRPDRCCRVGWYVRDMRTAEWLKAAGRAIVT